MKTDVMDLDTYRPELVAFASRLLRDPQEAEDCVQNAFVSALGAAPAPENPRAWLYRVVHNLAVNALRRRELEPPPKASAASVTVRENQEELERRLAALPQEQRTILLLRYTHGLSFGEIADVLGRPVGTVKVYAGRALSALHQSMEAEDVLRRRS